MPYHRGHTTWPAPLASARVVLRLGPFDGAVVSPTLQRRASAPRLTLRLRTEVPVLVRVESRRYAQWREIARMEESEGSFLVKDQGWPVRVWVTGTSPGWVDLVATP